MSIFGKIMSTIFGTSGTGTTPYAGAATAGAPGAGAPPASGSPAGAAKQMATIDVAANLDALAKASKEKFDWRKSIVDLMKLLNLDSSLGARKELAKELGYSGDMNDSAKMNVWLHKQVMTKLAENGGKVPDELK
jgi:hypothetical protein